MLDITLFHMLYCLPVRMLPIVTDSLYFESKETILARLLLEGLEKLVEHYEISREEQDE
jgi:hypothetical protein